MLGLNRDPERVRKRAVDRRRRDLGQREYAAGGGAAIERNQAGADERQQRFADACRKRRAGPLDLDRADRKGRAFAGEEVDAGARHDENETDDQRTHRSEPAISSRSRPRERQHVAHGQRHSLSPAPLLRHARDFAAGAPAPTSGVRKLERPEELDLALEKDAELLPRSSPRLHHQADCVLGPGASGVLDEVRVSG